MDAQVLINILKEASASDNPPQYIVDSIEKLKDTEPELYSIIADTRSQMLDCINDMSVDDRQKVVDDFKRVESL